eukprot:CAMPEP_0118693168 /NCGR_PEP_ID=MMETSP0800-20121206/11747_1 /TAXON_ID=210618 ORGANISM="Striatella unipunctata, Strain CCMP2910" /NCGR_SAMPLE_ID=MMETSP0800 /ASSEMBLY_ACC=CAM_ASM_000638 /LENGTH=156 /DNA_ID=CAMNT_0006591351 /DNA_START=115 /DNA_END=585 /DNA_ORIENTATION=+
MISTNTQNNHHMFVLREYIESVKALYKFLPQLESVPLAYNECLALIKTYAVCGRELAQSEQSMTITMMTPTMALDDMLPKKRMPSFFLLGRKTSDKLNEGARALEEIVNNNNNNTAYMTTLLVHDIGIRVEQLRQQANILRRVETQYGQTATVSVE